MNKHATGAWLAYVVIHINKLVHKNTTSLHLQEVQWLPVPIRPFNIIYHINYIVSLNLIAVGLLHGAAPERGVVWGYHDQLMLDGSQGGEKLQRTTKKIPSLGNLHVHVWTREQQKKRGHLARATTDRDRYTCTATYVCVISHYCTCWILSH